jgi:trans-aconitate 2-methyltransferase
VTDTLHRWDPAQYLKFSGPRLQPALDLLARIPSEAPKIVYDLGCGTGSLTRMLAERWPAARIVGIDGSAAMLDQARRGANGRNLSWVEADIRRWRADALADVIYSNAALHWLDDHTTVFPHILTQLAPGGVLAVQMPHNFAAPSHTCLAATIESGPWRERLSPMLRHAPVAAPADYHALIAPCVRRLDIWETEYLHVLEGDNPVVEWIKGSALRPFLDTLGGEERERFLADYGARIRAAYPPQGSGATLFPFRRLFILAEM